MPTLTELYEEQNSKTLSIRITIGGQVLAFSLAEQGFSLSGSFAWGVAPVCSIVLPHVVPSFVSVFNAGERPAVTVEIGFNSVMTRVFTGIVMDIENRESQAVISCVGEGRRLENSYQRTVRTLNNESAVAVVEELLDDAGVTNYAVAFEDWTIASVAPIILNFQTFGDAVNRIAEIKGSPWYETPAGQIRVELKDPKPAPSPFRQYFSGRLSALTTQQREEWIAGTITPATIQPPGITNADAKPRIRIGRISKRDLPRNVRNRVTVLGAVIETTQPDGTVSHDQVELMADASSPWIPNPPGYYEVTLSNELIDTVAIASDAAVRYVSLYNRLETLLRVAVDGDPEIFLGATVQIEDLDYSGTTGLWFVYGYNWSLDAQDYVTELDLRGGGPAAGSTPLVDPIACFQWRTTGKSDQVLPVGIGPGGRGIIVTFDAACSQDPDGTIASYAWTDTEGNVGSGQVVSFVYDPSVTTVDVTLTVTDADGRFDVKTHTVSPQGTDEEGQVLQAIYIYAAAGSHAMCSRDGGQTWTDIAKAAVAASGVSGDIVAVGAQETPSYGVLALFGTDQGEMFIVVDDATLGFIAQEIVVYQLHGEGPDMHMPDRTVGAGIVRIIPLPAHDSLEDYRNSWGLAFSNGRGFSFAQYDVESGSGTITHGDDPLDTTIYHHTNFASDTAGPGVWNGPYTPAIHDLVNRYIVHGENWISSPYRRVFAFGGDTGSPSTLIKGSQTGLGGNWDPIPLTGMEAAIAAAGAGHSIVSGAVSGTAMAIMFGSGVTPRAWYTPDFMNTAWTPATGLAAGVNGVWMEEGFDGASELLAVLANTRSYYADDDGVTFVDQGTFTEQINFVVHEAGQKNVYLGVTDDGIVKTIDAGDNWGYVRPHAGEGTTWPVGAIGYQVAYVGVTSFTTDDLYYVGSAVHQRLESSGWVDQDAAVPTTTSEQLQYFGNGLMFYIT